MTYAKHGTVTSVVEVTNVSPHGLWLLLDELELFLPYNLFPWFREAPIGKVVHVELFDRGARGEIGDPRAALGLEPLAYLHGTVAGRVARELGSEVRQSLSLIGMTALTLLASIGLGLLAGHIG